ncbi:MAG: DUF1553 domain-containing protein [Isosphaeraceae bacterium]|nr:DUF1553 domain-containing protein [Isosphaeraceae bacterium]
MRGSGCFRRVGRCRPAFPAGILAVLGALVAGASEISPSPKDRPALPEDRVLVEICERGLPEKEGWPDRPLPATEHYEADAFGFFRVPHTYIDTGVRADRANPFLLRATARVDLPAGRHRLLLRGHGGCRLIVDGKLALSTPFAPPITDGHNAIPTDYLDLGPDFRFAPPGNREAWTTIVSPGRTHDVVLETIVGGRRGNGTLRPELGETVVALALTGSGSFRLLAPHRDVPYTDDGWRKYAESEEAALRRLEAERRGAALARYGPERQRQLERARRWLASTPGPEVPKLPPGAPAQNAIDHFLAAASAAEARPAAAKGTVDFPKQVRPILEAKCFACHQGRKVRGDLRLDLRASALAGGASGEPAIVPGRTDESALIARVTSEAKSERMPPEGERLSAGEVQLLLRWIDEGAAWTSLHTQDVTPLTDDPAFLRRVTLDTVGVIPTETETRTFFADPRADKRARAIDRLLADPRWADHWVSYWQDVLAENPNILNPTLNNTGPFRWWLYESLLDNKPVDLFVTELVRMRGSLYLGGPAGFGMASTNDVPMAEKAAIVASAFLGVRMKCARCHDAPAHESTQEDLFQLAAMLAEQPITVPSTSSVPQDKLHGQGGRKPLIKVTLQPGTTVPPAWPFPDLSTLSTTDPPLPPDASPRNRLAALLTAPENERFAQVVANRVWERLMGRGLVDPVDDWEKGTPSHPELLRYLGRELVRGDYDLKHLVRLILNSHAYQRASAPGLTEPAPHFAAPARRRLTAEQIVDSLFQATGKAFETEEINLDLDAGRDIKNSLSLGKPQRAWQFASTSNERDRPSLSLPRVQAVVDVLEAFGWRSARQDPLTVRDATPNLLQPAILANGPVGVWLTRLSDDHGTARLALEDQPLETLVDRLFVRVLTRSPRPEESAAIVEYLHPGYDQRQVEPRPGRVATAPRRPPRYVSWSNHLTEEANAIKIEREAEARRGDPPTDRLAPAWRARLEDVLWSLLNSPEFLFMP